MQVRIEEKDTELNECQKEAAINKEDQVLWVVFKEINIPIQKINKKS